MQTVSRGGHKTLFCHMKSELVGEVISFLTGNPFAKTLAEFGSAVLHWEKEEEVNFELSAAPN